MRRKADSRLGPWEEQASMLFIITLIVAVLYHRPARARVAVVTRAW
jgi:hypothetical protein